MHSKHTLINSASSPMLFNNVKTNKKYLKQ